MTSADTARDLDKRDPLASFRDRFLPLDPPETIYLAGHSLGQTAVAVRDAINATTQAWAARGVAAWHDDDWLHLPHIAGDALAHYDILQTSPGELLVCDNTTVNLYKLAAAVLAGARRKVIVTANSEFPSDGYVLRSLAAIHGCELRTIHVRNPDRGPTIHQVRDACTGGADLVALSHVAYRSGALADLAGITEVAHQFGALMLWDLSHSVGVMPIPLRDANVDLAVGCTYKYLNAGPGAPAFLFVRQELADELDQPVHGWFSHRHQFDMRSTYRAARGVDRFLTGTPPVAGCRAVIASAEMIGQAGIDTAWRKTQSLTAYAADLVTQLLSPYGVRIASPRNPAHRGGHLTIHHPQAYQLCDALGQAGVVCDWRRPRRIRLGCSPLTTTHLDLWHAISLAADILARSDHLRFTRTIAG